MMHFSLYRDKLKVTTITTLYDFQYKPIRPSRYRNRVTINELKGSGSIDTKWPPSLRLASTVYRHLKIPVDLAITLESCELC